MFCEDMPQEKKAGAIEMKEPHMKENGVLWQYQKILKKQLLLMRCGYIESNFLDISLRLLYIYIYIWIPHSGSILHVIFQVSVQKWSTILSLFFNLMTKLHSYSCVLEWASSTSLVSLPKRGKKYIKKNNNILKNKRKKTRKYKGELKPLQCYKSHSAGPAGASGLTDVLSFSSLCCKGERIC